MPDTQAKQDSDDDKSPREGIALANLSHDHEKLNERFSELKSKHKKQDFLNTLLILLLFNLFVAQIASLWPSVISLGGSVLYLDIMAKWYNFHGIVRILEDTYYRILNALHKPNKTDLKKKKEGFEPEPENPEQLNL